MCIEKRKCINGVISKFLITLIKLLNDHVQWNLWPIAAKRGKEDKMEECGMRWIKMRKHSLFRKIMHKGGGDIVSWRRLSLWNHSLASMLLLANAMTAPPALVLLPEKTAFLQCPLCPSQKTMNRGAAVYTTAGHVILICVCWLLSRTPLHTCADSQNLPKTTSASCSPCIILPN